MEEKENIVNQTTNTLVQRNPVNELLAQLGNLKVFPKEILKVIFNFLDFPALYYLSLTSKYIRELVLPIYKKIPGPMIEGRLNGYNLIDTLELHKYLEDKKSCLITKSWLLAKNLIIDAGCSIDNQELLKYLAKLEILVLINCRIDRKLLELILTYASKLRVVVLKDLTASIPFELIRKLLEIEELRISELLSETDSEMAFCNLRILEWNDPWLKTFPSWILSLKTLESFKVPKSLIEEIPKDLRLMQTLKDFELHSDYPITNSEDFDYFTMPQLKRLVLSDGEQLDSVKEEKFEYLNIPFPYRSALTENMSPECREN